MVATPWSIAPALVSVEVFRVRNTYDVLIVSHDVVQPADGRRGRIEAKVLFRGRQGYLPLDLTGDEKKMAGQIVPEFFNKAGEPIAVPATFGKVLRAAVRGATCVGCTHQHYLAAPKAQQQEQQRRETERDRRRGSGRRVEWDRGGEDAVAV